MSDSRDSIAYGTSLEGFFHPKAVAVVGASERPNSVGRTLLWNLLTSPFGGTVFPVNSRRRSVLGVRAYESLAAVGEPLDLAVIATPAAAVPGAMEECARAGVRNVVVVSAFRDNGMAGLSEQAETLATARRNGIRVLGPYSLGVMVPRTGFNATVTAGRATPGRLGVVSQSGTMCAAILDWAEQACVGFSAFVSTGDMLDVDLGDLVYYLGDDPDTRCILLYVEAVGAPRAFLSAAREVANRKPIVVMKGGRRGGAATAGVDDEVFDAALWRSAVLRVATIEELFGMAEVLGRQPLPKGRRLAIVTNAGGPAALATAALTADAGELATLSDTTRAALDEVLPPQWSGTNPLAGLGDALADTYPKAIEILAKDPGVNGILVVLTPKPTVDATLVATRVKEAAASLRVPVLASWMGGEAVTAGRAVLRDGGIPCLPFPDAAPRIFNYLWRYKEGLNCLYETPQPPSEWGFHEHEWVRETLSDVLRRAREERRNFLTEPESRKILEAYGIQALRACVATTAAEAVGRAREIGGPVALEALVRLPPERSAAHMGVLSEANADWAGAARSGERVATAEDAGRAYERMDREVCDRVGRHAFGGVYVKALPDPRAHSLILGSDVDARFGPVLYFGAGGWHGRVYDDRGIGLPPLNTNLARRLMEQTRICRALRAQAEFAGPLSQMETVLTRFAQLVMDQPLIREIRIDPLHIGPAGVHAGDARMVVAPEGAPPRAKLAIRPYPAEYEKQAVTRDGLSVTLRPIRPEDEPLMVAFHRRLSDRTVYSRYFGPLHVDQRTRHQSLSRDCFTDYERNFILVAEQGAPQAEIVGIGRLVRLRGTPDAEFAVMVEDRLQGLGLGRELLAHLITIASGEGMRRLVGHILPENRGMIGLCERTGFAITQGSDDECVEALLVVEGA
jgi:acetyltransferase